MEVEHSKNERGPDDGGGGGDGGSSAGALMAFVPQMPLMNIGCC